LAVQSAGQNQQNDLGLRQLGLSEWDKNNYWAYANTFGLVINQTQQAGRALSFVSGETNQNKTHPDGGSRDGAGVGEH
jgi:hypothetical protein